MKKVVRASLVTLMIGCFVAPACATLITSMPGGEIIDMPAINYRGSTAQVFGPGITWSSSNSARQGGSVFGYTYGYNFGDNGNWNNSIGAMAGLNSASAFYGVADTMTFAFSSPLSGVGGIINYWNGGNGPTTISVYDSDLNLLESSALDFSTGGAANSGRFYGFQEENRVISYFTLTDNYIGLTDLTINEATPVPEPSTLFLLGAGLAGVVLSKRKISGNK